MHTVYERSKRRLTEQSRARQEVDLTSNTVPLPHGCGSERVSAQRVRTALDGTEPSASGGSGSGLMIYTGPLLTVAALNVLPYGGTQCQSRPSVASCNLRPGFMNPLPYGRGSERVCGAG